jgi:hypothetical protein
MREARWFTTKRLESIMENYIYYENSFLKRAKRELDKRYRKRTILKQRAQDKSIYEDFLRRERKKNKKK